MVGVGGFALWRDLEHGLDFSPNGDPHTPLMSCCKDWRKEALGREPGIWRPRGIFTNLSFVAAAVSVQLCLVGELGNTTAILCYCRVRKVQIHT